MLLLASVERFGVSRMRDFYLLSPENGINMDIIIFMFRSLYEFLRHLLPPDLRELPVVFLWEPMEIESGGQDHPPR